MAFTVEDGTQVVGANAYMTVQQFKDHHDDRGRDYSTFTPDTAIEAAIVKATDYIDKRFGKRFRGSRASSTQGLEWPRDAAYDDDNRLFDPIPGQLLKGCAEYTLQSLVSGTELAPVPSPVAGKISEEKVGPISTKYAPGTQPMTSTGNMSQNIPEYPEADMWMEELIEGSTSRRLIRG